MALSDRIAVMADGRVLQIDTPAGLYEAPRTRRVAGFIGSMNFLPPEVAARAGGAGAAAGIAIRPERIALHTAPPGPPALAGRLLERVYLGERVQYHVQLDETGARLNVSAPNTALVAADPGAAVWLTWPAEALIPLAED